MQPDATDFQAELLASLPRLRRFALSLTRHPSEGDDLVQMTCERAITNAAKWNPEQPLLPWLYTMARNLWTSEMRKRQVRTGEGTVPAEEAAELVSHAGGEEATRAGQVMAQIMALPEGLSSVLLLVSVEGHSYAEAAAILDIPPGTVMSRMSAARVRLRAALAGEAA
ncbi:RNA polymerase sigma factor [Vannielia litorea]|uniref:RNA polymerase sigma factor n=1 Tax=Vannielia litorea TaxID=1217970 RepID=UPI001C96E14F|nr:RNA polymerase sigma factor [Vannielia litorea]MBY6154520.1 RNA polymerase sigma factor [Vannielia litorea]